MNRIARLLLVICAVVIAGVFAGPNVGESGEPPSQAPAVAPPQPVAQSPAVAPAAKAPPVANKSGRKVLVDDTVNDAQLKQILSKGYRPGGQVRGNEVYYCRSEHELGSRFETKVCKTATRILQEEQQGKEATTNTQRPGGSKAQDK